MNLYEIFDARERELVGKINKLENREYSKDEVIRLENKILDDIMSNSKNDISNAKNQYSVILDKLESYR